MQYATVIIMSIFAGYQSSSSRCSSRGPPSVAGSDMSASSDPDVRIQTDRHAVGQRASTTHKKHNRPSTTHNKHSISLPLADSTLTKGSTNKPKSSSGASTPAEGATDKADIQIRKHTKYYRAWPQSGSPSTMIPMSVQTPEGSNGDGDTHRDTTASLLIREGRHGRLTLTSSGSEY